MRERWQQHEMRVKKCVRACTLCHARNAGTTAGREVALLVVGAGDATFPPKNYSRIQYCPVSIAPSNLCKPQSCNHVSHERKSTIYSQTLGTPEKGTVVDRWSMFRDHLCKLYSNYDPKMVVGGHYL